MIAVWCGVACMNSAYFLERQVVKLCFLEINMGFCVIKSHKIVIVYLFL